MERVSRASEYIDELPEPSVVRRSIRVATMLRAERHGARSIDEAYEYLVTGFAISLDACQLYGRFALWADPTTWDEYQRVDRLRVTRAQLLRARAFLIAHLSHAHVPATCALETSDGVVAYWKLAKPLVGTRAVRDSVDQVAWQLASRLHGAVVAGVSVDLPAPVMYRSGDRTLLAAKLLWCHAERVYDLELVRAATQNRSRALAERPVLRGGATGAKPPVMLEARTLAEGWTLPELGLTPALLAVLTGGGGQTGWLDLRWIDHLAEWMAARRFGFFDLVEVLRLGGVAERMEADVGGRGHLRLTACFENALRRASDRDSPRLPYGITRIVPVGEQTLGRPGERFLIIGGSKAMPFELEVSYDVLCSPKAVRRALGQRLGLLPYVVSKRVWDALLTAGLHDPRVRCRPADARRSARPSLAALLIGYAGTAKPLGGVVGATVRPTAEAWPLAKDGLALFPLTHARTWINSRLAGEVPRLGEVTAAVRALGGEAFGTVRLPGSRFAKCWCMPLHASPSGRR